jgi:acyl-coenzyme A thioesterase PaaI-like protein
MDELLPPDVPGNSPGVFDPAVHGWEVDSTTPFTLFVGPIWRRFIGGQFVYGFLTDQRHANANGIVDRGVVLTFADHAIGMAAARQRPGLPQVTLQLSTMFSADVEVGNFIEGRGDVVHSSGSFIFVRGLLTTGELTVASCEGIWKAVKPPAGP